MENASGDGTLITETEVDVVLPSYEKKTEGSGITNRAFVNGEATTGSHL